MHNDNGMRPGCSDALPGGDALEPSSQVILKQFPDAADRARHAAIRWFAPGARCPFPASIAARGTRRLTP